MHSPSVVVSLLFVLSLPAQQRAAPPTPAGETAAVFTACEAFAFARCQLIAAQVQGHGVSTSHRDVPGYRVFGGELPWSEATGATESKTAAIPFVYLVPAVEDGAAVRVFCVRGDGAVAWSDNTAGTGKANGRSPEVEDALGEGGPRAASNFPRSPSRGRDGNLWLPADLVRTSRITVRVVDETGAPMGMVGVSLEPGEDGYAIDVPLPAGSARTFHEGDAVITGVPARGLTVMVDLDAVRMAVEPALVAATNSSLRVAMPRAAFTRLRMLKNESAAIATLKNISSAQAQCQASGAIDANGNGSGEYGTFAELTGRDVVRGGDKAINPPVLSTAFRKVDNGVVVRSGYCFRIWLPGKDGVPIGEAPKGGLAVADVDAGRAETTWCLYAWPVEAGVSGQRAFLMDQSGDVLASPNVDGRYSGVPKPPEPSAARKQGSSGKLDAPGAANAVGVDGQTWVVIG